MWGAGDQGRVNKAILEDLNCKLELLIDDTPGIQSPFPSVPLIAGKEIDKWFSGKSNEGRGFVIAIGNPFGHIRIKFQDLLSTHGMIPVSLVDPTSSIRSTVEFGSGIQVMPHAIIHNDVKIGNQCIINTRALVEHDCVLSDGVEIGPGAILCGRVEVGENSWVGAGAVVRPRIKIGKNCIIGAGAVVVSDIPDNVVAVGCPAKPLQKNK